MNEMKKNQTFCLQCGLPLVGRADKKYCDDGCRNAYLKQNYGLLAEHLHSGQDVVHKDELLLAGFDPKFTTCMELLHDGTMCYGLYDLEYFEQNGRYIKIRKAQLPSPPRWGR
jgi:hypothetical protein